MFICSVTHNAQAIETMYVLTDRSTDTEIVVYIQNGYQSVMKGKEILLRENKRMKLVGIMPSEISQMQKTNTHDIHYM